MTLIMAFKRFCSSYKSTNQTDDSKWFNTPSVYWLTGSIEEDTQQAQNTALWLASNITSGVFVVLFPPCCLKCTPCPYVTPTPPKTFPTSTLLVCKIHFVETFLHFSRKRKLLYIIFFIDSQVNKHLIFGIDSNELVSVDWSCVLLLCKLTFSSVQIQKCIVNLGCVEKERLYLYEYYMMHFEYIFKYLK